MKHSIVTTSNPIGHRLKLEMKKRGVSSADLAKRADVKTSFIYDVISGKSANPSTVKLARVAESLGVSLTYLVGSHDDLAAQQRPSLRDDYLFVPRLMVDMAGEMLCVEQQSDAYCFRKTWIREHLHVAPDTVRLMQLRDDSMVPTFRPNDMLMIDISRKKPSPPGVFALFDGFGLVVKRLEYSQQQQPPQIHVMSDNANYSSYQRSPEETFIIGRVVWFSREI